MFESLVCSKCRKPLTRKKQKLVCLGGCRKEYSIVGKAAIIWQELQEKNRLVQRMIKEELGVSQRLVKDKKLGREYWARHLESSPAARMIDEKAFRGLERLLGKSGFSSFRDARVLVVGCGGGKDAAWLLKNGAKEVVGTDISLDLMKEAQKRFAESRKKPAWYFVANAEDLPLIEDSFDLVLFGSTLHHVPRPRLALVSAARVAPVIAGVAEPARMGFLNPFLEKFGWCTEYGGLKTHRFSPKQLESWFNKLGYRTRVKTDFIWFPLSLLSFLVGSQTFLRAYFGLLRLADALLGRWGHNLTFVAVRKAAVRKAAVRK